MLPYYAGDDGGARPGRQRFQVLGTDAVLRARGLRVFDYGRSKQGTGSYAFKKNWGFEPKPLFYEYRLYRRDSIPQNNPANAKYRLFIGAWRRLPIGVANWLGPFIVRTISRNQRQRQSPYLVSGSLSPWSRRQGSPFHPPRSLAAVGTEGPEPSSMTRMFSLPTPPDWSPERGIVRCPAAMAKLA